jgi:phosphoribosylformylglycinamidine synthase
MAFGGGRGLDADIPGTDPFAALFSEELGCVLQVAEADADAVVDAFRAEGIDARDIGAPSATRDIVIRVGGAPVLSGTVNGWRKIWSELTWEMQSIRDNPACARQEYDIAGDATDPGMNFKVTFDPDEKTEITVRQAPRIAILREQGINGHVEMAAAFENAGFEAIDVHMTDLHEGRVDLADFGGLVACGGFSYGDVLGSGTGWASSILFSQRLAEMFGKFFHRPETFTLGVCNGCQMVSQLKDLIPGAENWPHFVHNVSEQFEARYATIEILQSPSIFFKGMEGSRLPIAVAHGDGHAAFDGETRAALVRDGLAAVRYVDNFGKATETYPWNPNGSIGGLTGFTTPDGRATIMMPHPERGFRSLQLSYRPADLFAGESGPWMRMFRNAFAFANAR